MPPGVDTFWLIVAAIAVLCVVLFPIRLWRRRRHRYGHDPDEGGRPD